MRRWYRWGVNVRNFNNSDIISDKLLPLEILSKIDLKVVGRVSADTWENFKYKIIFGQSIDGNFIKNRLESFCGNFLNT